MDTIGRAATGVVTSLTASPPRSTKWLASKPAITLPTNQAECDALREWAETAPFEAEPAASPEQLARHLAFLASALPSQSKDDVSGKMRVAVYASILSDFSDRALAYMSRTACQTLRWFPTPSECLKILEGYEKPTTDKDLALSYCARFTQDRFDDWLARLRDGTVETLEEIPDRWCRIAYERGFLKRQDDGSFTIRKAGPPPASTPANVSPPPARKPTRGDYIALGMTPDEVDAAMAAITEEERRAA